MFSYLVIYVLSVVFSICYSFAKDKNLIFILHIICFLVLFIPASMRYEIGTDYENYAKAISMGFFQNKYDIFEIGWQPILFFIDRFNVDIHLFFVFAAFITYFSLFSVVDRRDLFLVLPMYICIPYLESFSLVRQAMAATIFLVAIKFCAEHKYFRAFILALVSTLFHLSTIALCLILLLSNFKWKFFSPTRNLFLFCFVYLIFTVFDFTEMIFFFISVTKYGVYINSKYNQATEMGSGLGVLLRELQCLAIVFVSSKYIRSGRIYSSNKVVLHFNMYKIVCVFCFCQVIFYALSTKIHIFGRLPNLINPFLPVAFSYVANSKSKYRRLAIIFMYTTYFVLFLATLIANPSSAEGGLGLTPYKSILMR